MFTEIHFITVSLVAGTSGSAHVDKENRDTNVPASFEDQLQKAIDAAISKDNTDDQHLTRSLIEKEFQLFKYTGKEQTSKRVSKADIHRKRESILDIQKFRN